MTVRLRVLTAPPIRDSLAEIGERKGEAVSIAIYSDETKKTFSSDVLSIPYEFSQRLNDVSDSSKINLVLITGADTDDEDIVLIPNADLSVSELSLALADVGIASDFVLTEAIIWAVAIEEGSQPTSIRVATGEITNTGGSNTGSGNSSGETTDTEGEFGDSVDSTCANLAGGVWVSVPANPEVGQDDNFCLMKYEAKNSGGAYSEPQGLPWGNITRAEAVSACIALGEGYTLTSNTMWQAVARNIESVDSNWNITGDDPSPKGIISKGNHYSGFSAQADIIGDPDDDPTTGTGAANNAVYRRIHDLSNNQKIWDISGNASEWVTAESGEASSCISGFC